MKSGLHGAVISLLRNLVANCFKGAVRGKTQKGGKWGVTGPLWEIYIGERGSGWLSRPDFAFYPHI